MPPARRERARRSARLKSDDPLHSRAMDYEASQGLPKPPETSTPRLAIQWQSDRSLTDTLVNYLTTHSADCRILFYSDGKRVMAAADDNPSGSDKGQIHQNIAKLLFASHPKYGAAYTINPKKFRDAVGNRIGTYVPFFLGSVDQITKIPAVSGANIRKSRRHLAALALE